MEHTYAVFLWRPLYKELEFAKAPSSPTEPCSQKALSVAWMAWPVLQASGSAGLLPRVVAGSSVPASTPEQIPKFCA